MRTIKVTIGIDHFRLDPNSEFDTRFLYTVDKIGKSIRETVGVSIPVTETCSIMETLSKPAVIHYNHIHTVLYSFVTKIDEDIFVNVEVASFPSVKYNRALLERVTRNDSIANKLMHITRHSAEAIGRIGHDCLG